ncbi:P2X purinoceptor 7-like [Ruditapes philippinarum]|uniref:P2X purinoceptor 7-like n=1 Tax=Ruditapes philippinarum TaxID=129788 RepID=UPI00295C242A|nr:P2X purinoceptor 7-like [Ruditapes philippinarum]
MFIFTLSVTMAYSSSSESFDEFSSNNTSLDDESSPEGENYGEGINPYQFEPLRTALVSSNESNSGEENDDVESTQLQDVGEWCTCHNCQMMATAVECRCCCRVTRVSDKMDEHKTETGQGLSCITAHPGFSTVCLDRYVLETAYLQYRQQYGERDEEDINRRHRYTAYRQLARWCWGYLGKEVRVVLPSCAVIKIRTTYPSEDYEGFHFAG